MRLRVARFGFKVSKVIRKSNKNILQTLLLLEIKLNIYTTYVDGVQTGMFKKIS